MKRHQAKNGNPIHLEPERQSSFRECCLWMCLRARGQQVAPSQTELSESNNMTTNRAAIANQIMKNNKNPQVF